MGTHPYTTTSRHEFSLTINSNTCNTGPFTYVDSNGVTKNIYYVYICAKDIKHGLIDGKLPIGHTNIGYDSSTPDENYEENYADKRDIFQIDNECELRHHRRCFFGFHRGKCLKPREAFSLGLNYA